ncbi:hypothetical protein [Virgibacillus profundi]|uniref:hypothetical protein n=1 Tax=Virgibacillus profundi TaxID=2024555 RepID=UPI0013FE25D1|nr:hypothetical protein [Virgibacillus profundi]
MYVNWIDKDGRHSVKCSDKITAKILYKQIKDFKVKEISNDEYGFTGYKNSKYRLLAV